MPNEWILIFIYRGLLAVAHDARREAQRQLETIQGELAKLERYQFMLNRGAGVKDSLAVAHGGREEAENQPEARMDKGSDRGREVVPKGHKSGVQTSERVTLIFDTQTAATAWFEGFMDRCDGTAPAVLQGWIAVGERLPEPGKPVLLDIGKKHPIRAMWAARLTLEAGDECPEDWAEYDDAADKYYCPEGWYEWNEHEDTHWRVSADPIRWMPLPQPPKVKT